MKNILSEFKANNIFAGLIVAVVALPLCIAFAIASGAGPLAGIVSGVVGGLIAGALGSSRYQVSGPAAAFITIIFGLIAQHGFPALLASTFIAGLVVLGMATLRLGRIMELMPHSIIVGFTTGIGILIVLGQIPTALGIAAKGKDVLEKLAFTQAHLGEARMGELAVLLATLAVSLIYARTRAAKWVPTPLVALIAGTVAAQLLLAFGVTVQTIGSLYDISLSSVSVSPDFLSALEGHVRPVLLAGLTLGLLIAVESLLSAKALDQMTGTSHDPNRELVGLGVANLVVPFVGGLPVSGVIVRGSTNVMSGGTHKSAAVLHAVFLALFVAALYAAIKLLPMAALAAVLLLTGQRLVEAHEIRRIFNIDRVEGALVVLTVVLTVTVDLTVSVPLGVALMLVVALRRMLEEKRMDVRTQHGQTVLTLRTNVTFLTAAGVKEDIDHHIAADKIDALDLTRVHYLDATGSVMLAETLRRHDRVSVWVGDQTALAKLAHAGVDENRISLLGSRMVNLPEVFRRIEQAPAV